MRKTLAGGRATLYRGDCLDVLRRLRSNTYDAVIVDPPYGLNYQSGRRKVRFPKLLEDGKPFIWFLHDAYRVCRDGGALLCFCIGRTQEAFRFAIDNAGWKIKSQVVWDRVHHGMGDCLRTFAPQHDVMWFATKGRFRFHDRRPKSVLRHQRLSGQQLVHPTQKPEALMMDLVRYIVPPGGRVLDPCMGSGSTGVAAIRTGRRFTGIEKEARYFGIATRRIREVMAT